jgi:acetyltransferase-like isoleucine patch superfamily enzyme
MKKYIREAVKGLQKSGNKKIVLTLKSKNDYKKNPFCLFYNKLIFKLQKKVVPWRFKNLVLRTTGMNIGKDACIPHDIYFDPYFPELIYLDKGCIIGGESNICTHQIKGKKLVLGKCILKERTLLGGLSALLPGSIINRNSILNFFSELDREIPEGELWGGKPAKLIKKFSEEEIEKYFKPSNMRYREYYKEFKKEVRAFMKDPSRNFLKIHYNGKRLNAGNDWWRARNIFRIVYNGIIIEITRLLPHCFLKTLLFRMVGMKIGKNCRIGKGTLFDHIYCDTVTLEDNVTIDDHCYFDGHEYTISQTIFGKTLLKRGVHIKHHSYVRIGTTIGENTIIEPYSMAQREIPADEVWGGMPVAKFIRKRKK